MFAWQIAVVAKFKGSSQTLSVAWLLFSLCQKHGYAYASDTYISKTLGIQVNHVQATLTALEKVGAIVRASVFVDGQPQRRIWPSAKIIPP
jgi:transcription initiation factor IIE alpha subunit